MQYVNQHSFVLLSLAALLVLTGVLLHDGVRGSDLVAIAALAVGLGLAFLLLRPGPATETQAERVFAEVGAGKPVLLEFQSPY